MPKSKPCIPSPGPDTRVHLSRASQTTAPGRSDFFVHEPSSDDLLSYLILSARRRLGCRMLFTFLPTAKSTCSFEARHVASKPCMQFRSPVASKPCMQLRSPAFRFEVEPVFLFCVRLVASADISASRPLLQLRMKSTSSPSNCLQIMSMILTPTPQITTMLWSRTK